MSPESSPPPIARSISDSGVPSLRRYETRSQSRGRTVTRSGLRTFDHVLITKPSRNGQSSAKRSHTQDDRDAGDARGDGNEDDEDDEDDTDVGDNVGDDGDYVENDGDYVEDNGDDSRESGSGASYLSSYVNLSLIDAF
jgi:hypothetical protein